MYQDLESKVVIVTGGSSGIGRETARLFARNHCRIVIIYKSNHEQAQSLIFDLQKAGVEALAIRADVTSEDEVKSAYDQIIRRFSQIDILVNNVGGYYDGDTWNGNPATWQKSFNLNLNSVLLFSKQVAAHFIARQTGIIVNVSSRFSQRGDFDTLTYAASKAALLNVTQSYAKRLSPFGRANAVSPGATKAGYWTTAPKDELEAAQSRNPHGRLIEPTEIASVIVFLASDNASMVNGQNLLVDGGASLF